MAPCCSRQGLNRQVQLNVLGPKNVVHVSLDMRVYCMGFSLLFAATTTINMLRITTQALNSQTNAKLHRQEGQGHLLTMVCFQ